MRFLILEPIPDPSLTKGREEWMRLIVRGSYILFSLFRIDNGVFSVFGRHYIGGRIFLFVTSPFTCPFGRVGAKSNKKEKLVEVGNLEYRISNIEQGMMI